MSQYIFDNRAVHQARQRFAGLETIYDPATTRYLSATGLSPGWRCLEIGGGGGSIGTWLGRQVGPFGYVLITDINPSLLAELGEINQLNVEVQTHDIVIDPLPEEAFDLIHARLVLVHLPKRDLALHRMAAALKHGGWLVIEDFDTTMIDHGFPTPDAGAAESYRRVYDAMKHLMTVRGVDLAWGRRLYQRLRPVSLIDVGTEGNLIVFQGGSAGSRIMRANFEQIRAEAVSAGLVTDEEVERVLALLDDPDFAISSPVMMSAWGRRP